MQYAHVITVDTSIDTSIEKPAVFPTRFDALNALFATITTAGVVVERTAIPGDSGLDSLCLFAEGTDDRFLISRINAWTFTIRRLSGSRRSKPSPGMPGRGLGEGSAKKDKWSTNNTNLHE